MIKHYLKTAVRNLMKYKSQSAIAIVGLGLALLCFSLCMNLSRYMFNVNESIENRDRIARIEVKLVNDDDDASVGNASSGNLATELRQKGLHNVDFCAVNRKEVRDYKVVFNEDRQLPYQLSSLETDSLFYKLFQPKILYGSWATTSHTPNAIVLSLQKAKQIFGNPTEAVGKQLISTDGSSNTASPTGGITYTITAVMEDFPTNTTLQFMSSFDALVLNDSEGGLHSVRFSGVQTFALVGEGLTVADFISQLDRQQLVVQQPLGDCLITAFPFEKDLSFDSSYQTMAMTITIAGFLVLLAGLLNFFYFLMGSFLIRIREYNIRRAHGAGLGALQLMLFVQSALYMALVGAVTFIGMAWLVNGWQLDLPYMSFTFQMDVLMQQTFSYLLALLIICMMMAVVLIHKVRKINISVGLFGALGGTNKHRLRTLMTGVQLVIAWIFLSLTVAFYLQSHHISKTIFSSLSTEEKERTLCVPLFYNYLSEVQKEEIVSRIQQINGVEQLTRTRDNMVGSSWFPAYFYKGERTRDNTIKVYYVDVDSNFFDFFHIPLLSGTLSKAPDQLMVDPILAQRLGDETLGMQLRDYNSNQLNTVTGVCKNPLHLIYGGKIQGEVLGEVYRICDFKGQYRFCYVKTAPGRTSDVKQSIEAIIHDVRPENIQPKTSTFMEDIEETQALELKLRKITFFMAIVAMLITLLGIYSAITLDTERRQKEMAIRKINGAKTHHIVILFARLYLKLLVVCAAIAFPVVGALINAVSPAYESVASFGFFFYLSVFLMVAVLVGMVLYVRIRNIARVNPAEMIKSE